MGIAGQRTPPPTPDPASADAPDGAPIPGAPAAHPTRSNMGAARGEEHGAPAPSTRIAPKLWAIAALVVLAVAAALAFG